MKSFLWQKFSRHIPYLPPYVALGVMGFLCFAPMIGIVWADEEVRSSGYSLAIILILSALLVGMLASVGGRKYAPWLGAVCQLFFPAELASLILAGSPVSFGLIQATFQTNAGEASELGGMYLLIGAIVLAVWGIYLWAWLSWRRGNKPISKWVRVGIAGAFVLYSVGLFARGIPFSSSDEPALERIDSAASSTFAKYVKVFPYDIFYSTASYLRVRRQELFYSSRIGEGNLEVTTTPAYGTDRPIVIFVIGETGNASHWQLMGYERETNPLLSKRTRIILFEDVASGADLTALSIPMLISRSTPEDFMRWQHEGSLMHLFRRAGFSTAWIGNQASDFSVVQAGLEQTDYHYYSGKEVNSLSSYDEILLPRLESYLRSIVRENRAAFAVVHTLGSHFRYDARCPEEFDIYQPTTRGLRSVEALNSMYHEERINSYDNTLRYTDYVLDEMITKIDSLSRPAVLVYIPDHGEGLGEINPQHKLHGSEFPLKDELEVPLFVSYNEAYAKRNRQLLATLTKNRQLPISVTEVPALLVRLSGVVSPQFPISVGDSTFRPQPRYYLSPSLQVRSADEVLRR